jgi:beta-N-acetylhexosaminidase
MSTISRRRFLLGAGHTVTAAATAALLSGRSLPVRAAVPPDPSPAPITDLTNSPVTPPSLPVVNQPLPVPEATLETKIGQMLLVGFGATALAPGSEVLDSIAAGKLGNVVLFGHNILGADQLRSLNASLQQVAPIPLLISLDQEGGYVSRLGSWAQLPFNYPAQYLGDTGDVELTRAQGVATADRLRDLGVNLNLAPVVDLNLNPRNPIVGNVQRSYSADPNVVVAHSQAAIEAHRERNIGTTLKHFPGHGSSRADTHLGFVDVTDTWQEIELSPYIQLLAAGDVDAIMTAHIFNARLDPTLPATLSSRVVNDLLRDKLGYNGVVITDDMRMRAISDIYRPEDAIQKAIEAGVDLIAISNNIPGTRMISADQAFAIMVRLVRFGRISEERIDQSYRRIMALKRNLGLIA